MFYCCAWQWLRLPPAALSVLRRRLCLGPFDLGSVEAEARKRRGAKGRFDAAGFWEAGARRRRGVRGGGKPAACARDKWAAAVAAVAEEEEEEGSTSQPRPWQGSMQRHRRAGRKRGRWC